MTIRLAFECDGCTAKADGIVPLRRDHVSFSGKPLANSVQDLAPEGWVSFDPYTSVTYCPTCWAGIVDGIQA